jgi:hypothetical protein
MPRRKLAVVQISARGLVLIVDLTLVLGLAIAHKPYLIALVSMTACIPGFVVAVLAWQGRLPSRCALRARARLSLRSQTSARSSACAS